MSEELRQAAETAFVPRVLSHYAWLAPPDVDAEPDLGGNLLYAGELDEDGRALVVASNVAGAASLSATANHHAQKHAIRDGIADFLVTSLDEALRILKNEIRKRAPVAVCVSANPAAVEAEMAERGVVADLRRPPAEPPVSVQSPDSVLVAWTVSSAPAQWMPKLDALALECLDPNAGATRRWLRLAPRYLGRLAHSTRMVHSSRQFAARFIDRIKQLDQAPVRVQVTSETGTEEFTSPHWLPPNP